MGAKEQMVTACPEITIVKKVEDIDFIVLATDGIWDRMTNQQVSLSRTFVNYIPYVQQHNYFVNFRW